MRSAGPGLPAEGEKVTTACGGAIEFTADTPRTLFQNRWLFFCLPDCRARFERNPADSCLVDHQTLPDDQTVS